jgi:hypothetical protein
MSLRPSRRVAPAAAAAASSPDPISQQQQSPPTPPTSDTEQKRQPQPEPEPELVIYEPFLYDLSPTWDAWCFLRVAEVHALVLHHDMGDHSAYFSGNLPIRWARIVGVVVAVDNYYEGKRRVFTIDDSSGACIECASLPDLSPPSQPASSVPRPLMSSAPSASATTTTTTTTTAAAAAVGPMLMYPDIRVGSVVEVKGRIVTFRHSRQLRIVSMKPVRCTAHEVVLWGKRVKFARETLGTRWAVDEKQIRRRRRKIDDHRAKARSRMTLKGSLGRSRCVPQQQQGRARETREESDDGEGSEGGVQQNEGGKRAGVGHGNITQKAEVQSREKQQQKQQQQQQPWKHGVQKEQQTTTRQNLEQDRLWKETRRQEEDDRRRRRERQLVQQQREDQLLKQLSQDPVVGVTTAAVAAVTAIPNNNNNSTRFVNRAKEKRERELALQRREQELAERLVSDDRDDDDDDE